jgi:plastocyanin
MEEKIMRSSLCKKTTTLGIVAALGLFSAGAFAGTTHNVTVGAGGNTFGPVDISIAAGDSVTWTYAGGAAPHNVVSDPGSVTMFRCANGCDGAGGDGTPSASGWTSTVTFPTAGTIAYFCEIHGAAGGVGMHGTITVTVPVDLQSFDVE